MRAILAIGLLCALGCAPDDRGGSASGTIGLSLGGVDDEGSTGDDSSTGEDPEAESGEVDTGTSGGPAGESTTAADSGPGTTDAPPRDDVQPWAIGTDIRVSVWPNADAAWLDGLVGRIQDASDLLWETSEGQHYIREVQIRDNTQSIFGNGGIHFHIENLGKDTVDSASGVYGYWDAAHSIHLGGQFQLFTFVHEWGHVAYGLPDEYGPQCGSCMQASTAWTWCDGTNHNPSSHPTPCWSIILNTHPSWNHPNVGYEPHPPAIEVTELIDQ